MRDCVSDFVLAAIAFYVAVFGHELGHVLAAKIVGFRVVGFSVRPFHLVRSPDGWQFQPKTRGRVPALGWVRCVPDRASRLRLRIASIIAGGPLFSLVIAFVGAGVADSRIYWMDARLNLFVWAIALWSAFLGSVSLIPLTSDDIASDGRRLLEIMRYGKTLVRTYAISGLLDAAGRMHPRTWDPGLVALALDDSIPLKRREPTLSSLNLSQPVSRASDPDIAPVLQFLRLHAAAATNNQRDIRRAFIAEMRRRRPGRPG